MKSDIDWQDRSGLLRFKAERQIGGALPFLKGMRPLSTPICTDGRSGIEHNFVLVDEWRHRILP